MDTIRTSKGNSFTLTVDTNKAGHKVITLAMVIDNDIECVELTRAEARELGTMLMLRSC